MILIDVDGRAAAVDTAGAPLPQGGPVVLLVHGAGNDASVWQHQLRGLLAADVTAVAVDLPGHGGSAGPTIETVPEMGAWVVALLDALGTTEASVVGHSMGSLVSLAAAAADPGRVRRIVLVATSGEMAVHPALQAAADAGDSAAIDMIVRWSHTPSAPEDPPGEGPRLTRRLLQANLAPLGPDLRACATFDGRRVAQRLAADRPDLRALVVSGEHDRMTPAAAGEEVAGLLGAAQVVVPGGSHTALYEDPDAVTDALLAFLLS